MAGNVSCKKKSLKQPSIVLCMADDQGWIDMAYFDHPVSMAMEIS